MGFCQRCGDIVQSGKCKRWGCGGKAVASITGSLHADGNMVDKWQSQYQGSILENASTGGTASRRPSFSRPAIPTAMVVPRKMCAECNKRLFSDTPTFIDPDDHDKLYCQSCHLKKFSMGNCRNCFKPVFPHERPWVKYGSRYWHKDCFNCRHCQRDLGDEPLVDLGGLPCCEICLEEHAGQRPEEIPTVHNIDTPSPSGLSSPLSPVPDKFDTMSNYSSPRLPPHSPIYWSDRSSAIGAQLSRPDSPQGSIYLPPQSSSPVSDYPFSDYSETSSRPSTPNSTFSFASKISSTISDEVIERAPSALSSTSTEPYYKPLKSTSTTTRSNRERTISLPSPVKPSTSPTVVERQQHRRHHNHQYEDDSSHNESETPIPAPSARLGRKVSTPLISAVHPQCDRCHESIHGTSVQLPTGEVFHQSCFTCSKCALEFTESQFIMNLGRVYHPKCAPMTQVETMGIKCTKCSVPIVGQFIRNNGGYYHLKCFNCAKCDRVISPNTPFTDIKGLHYCDGCATSPLSDVRPNRTPLSDVRPNRTPRTRTSPVLGATPRLPILPTHASVDDLPSLGSAQPFVRPSTIFSTRTKPLPKLGGSKVCPRCQKTVGFVEETSGPRATKWHKKCLGCAGPGCRKQLDSAAIIVEDGGMWIPYCRTCHDKQKQRTQSPRFPATRVGLMA